MSRQFSELNDTGRYLIGQQTKVFLSEPYRFGSPIPHETVFLDEDLMVGDETVTINTGFTYRLYEGTRLNFGTEEDPRAVFLSDVADPGQTELPILPATIGLYSGAPCILDTPIPLFSAKTVTADNALNFFSDQGFSNRKIAGRVSGITASGTASGAWIHTDPGYAIIRKAVKSGLMCKVQVLDGYGRGGQWAQAFFGLNRGRSVSQFTTLDYKIIVTGKWEIVYPNPEGISILPRQPDWPRYCPQTTPNYIIDFATVYTFTDTNYCPQTIPDYDFPGLGAQPPQQDTDYCPQDTTGFFDIDFGINYQTQTNTDYCPQDTTGFFDIDFVINYQTQTDTDYCPMQLSATTGVYCSQDTSGFFTNPLTGTGVYCSQDLNLPDDPHSFSVVLYLRGDGVNGSTNIVDLSPVPKTISVFGNTQISTAQSKYGGSSIYFDGTGDYLTTTDPGLGIGDFTIEAWIYSLNSFTPIVSNVPNNSFTSYYVLWGEYLETRLNGNSTQYKTSPEGTLTTTWTHVAGCRENGTLKFFMDGVLIGTASDGSLKLPARTMIIGGFLFTGFEYYFNGYIDSLRITKGVARYTTNFDPETDTYLSY